jgi:hypothetical protein
VRKELNSTLVIGEPADTALSLSANYIKIVHPPAGRAPSVLAMIKLHFNSVALAFCASSDGHYIGSLPGSVVIEDDVIS